MTNYISEQIDRVIASDYHDPFEVLGLHFIDQEGPAALVRTFQPHAESVQIVANGIKQYMYKMRQEGLFEIVLPEYSEPFPYTFEIQYYDKSIHSTADPYCFLPQLGEIDRYLFNSGTHYQLYDKLGAHQTRINDIELALSSGYGPLQPAE